LGKKLTSLGVLIQGKNPACLGGGGKAEQMSIAEKKKRVQKGRRSGGDWLLSPGIRWSSYQKGEGMVTSVHKKTGLNAVINRGGKNL